MIPHEFDIVLGTLNAKYIHAAFGLRYLMANLGGLGERACLLEFDINQRPTDVVERILERQPRVVGLGVYIWNAEASLQVAAEIKRVRPEVAVVVGGPEVSHETSEQEICRVADYVITGEADLAFADLCGQLLEGRRPLMKVIAAELPEFEGARAIRLPYHLYGADDVANRVIYVEASRGCPFKCEFCLSSLEVPVRQAPMGAFLEGLEGLLERGVRQFKFVDRTFNLNLNVSKAILEFFLDRWREGLFLHFEMIPDRLPEALRALIVKFPPAGLQFEVGIQTFNDEVAKLISRRQDNAKVEQNLRFLREQTGVHVHADLIAGLPGEDVGSFGRGFDRLVELGPQEIQVGILKRLRGTPIVRHDAEWGMVYSPRAPYEVLQTKLIDFGMMQRLRRFSRFWDLVSNSGNFVRSAPLLWGGAGDVKSGSAFDGFMRFSDWLFGRVGKNHGIALARLAEMIFEYLTVEHAIEPELAAAAIEADYTHGGLRDRPAFLEGHSGVPAKMDRKGSLPARQMRHLRI